MGLDRREAWVGRVGRFGILQRLGIAGFVISLGLVGLAFDAPGHASLRYWLFVAAHAILYAGFVIAAVADQVAQRAFSVGRLVYAVTVGFTYAVLGPVIMAAAA